MLELQIFVRTILSMSRRSIPLAYLFILVSCSRHAFDSVMEQGKLHLCCRKDVKAPDCKSEKPGGANPNSECAASRKPAPQLVVNNQ